MKHLTMSLILFLLAGCSKVDDRDSADSDPLVFPGDSLQRVTEMLGDPGIEFPRGDTLVHWYAGDEVVFSNNVAIAVTSRPIANAEEQTEKEERAKLANDRLLSAYNAVSKQEKIEYDAWLERERKREAEERADLARIEAYEERKAAEKREAIRAYARKKSCGCYYHVHCRH